MPAPPPRPVTPPAAAAPAVQPMSPIAYPGLPMSVPPQPPAPRYRPLSPAPGFREPAPDRLTGEPLSSRSSLTAGLLQVFLGGVGAGRFYTGHVALAFAQMSVAWGILVIGLCAGFALVVPWLFMWVGFIWPVIDGIVLLAGNQRDSDGYRLRS
jgi:hypothetical protein